MVISVPLEASKETLQLQIMNGCRYESGVGKDLGESGPDLFKVTVTKFSSERLREAKAIGQLPVVYPRLKLNILNSEQGQTTD
jgi:hypothetical protein